MIKWVFKHFEDLSPGELYSVLQLRNEVFVVEQNCVFQDADNKDQPSYHLMGWDDEKLVACSRIVPKGIAYDEMPSIGRIVTSSVVRRTGIGRLLMENSIKELERLFGTISIRLGAQYYLKKFYESFGFIQSGEIYLEDGIQHIEMTKPTSSTK
ncbi:MAG TPA: GNAT family N-acetyltransferase [Chitinophagaceae bacterium]|jgi:ElaA protein